MAALRRLPQRAAAAGAREWRAGDTIPLGRRTLRVISVRYDDADQTPVLVVEDTADTE